MAFNAQHEKRKRKEHLIEKVKLEGLDKELTDVDELYTRPTEEIKFNDFTVSTDSGAHSIYKEFFVVGDKISAQARLKADYSYIKTKEFKKFLDDYIEHCLKYKELYNFYVTLDIINNPEESWKITEYMETCGLTPIPVFHNGEDIHWLERMVEKYPYIGISGLGQDITKTKFKPFGDSCFKVICDKHGKPKCKVHGFAMGAPEIIKMYPWYSADQSTWTYMSRVGSLLVPKPIHKGKELIDYDFLNLYKVIPVTNRRDVEAYHVNNLTDLMKHFVMLYLEQNDIDLEAVRESYHWRDVANIRLFNNIEKAAKNWYKEQFDYEEGGNIYFAGTAAGAGTNRSRLIKLMHDVKVDKMKWLVSPVYQQHAENIRALVQANKEGIDWRTLWDEETASKVRKSNFLIIEKKPVKERKVINVKRNPIELDMTLTFKVKKIIDGNYYHSMTLSKIANLELKHTLENIEATVKGVTPDVEIQLKSGNEHVKTSTELSQIKPRPIKKTETYGFF